MSIDTKLSSDDIHDDVSYQITCDHLCQSSPKAASFIQMMFNISKRFNALRLTEGEIALFSALVFITPGTNVDLSHLLQAHIQFETRDNCV